MNEKTTKEKLRINKETIRNLSDESLDQVAGGGGQSAIVVCNVTAKKSCVCSIIC